MAKMLKHSEAIIRGDAPPPPIARLIGCDLISVKPGEGVVEFQATEAHANPMGTLHGGVLCDIADIAMGVAYSSNLDKGESFTTLELKINFLNPALAEKWETLRDVNAARECEVRLRRSDGVFRWFSLRCEPLHDESRALVRWYGTAADIEILKQTEEKLREDEREPMARQHS